MGQRASPFFLVRLYRFAVVVGGLHDGHVRGDQLEARALAERVLFRRPVEARGRDAVLDRIFEVVHFGSFPFKMTYRVRSDMEKWKNVVKQAKIVFAAQSRLA